MNEDVLEVLLFIFEHFLDDDSHYLEQDEDLVTTLVECGFSRNEISKAMLWLDDLVDLREHSYLPAASNTTGIRIYTDSEMEKLDVDCRGFILFLEQMNVLDYHTREMVIDRAIALEMELKGDSIDMERLKWVVMMVLYNMPDRESEYVWIENMDLQYLIH